MPPFRIDFDALDWHSSLPGARAKVYRNGARQLRLVEFTSEFVEPQWCERGHVGLVLAGVLEVGFRGQVISYPEGSGIFIPQGPRARTRRVPSLPSFAWFWSKMHSPENHDRFSLRRHSNR